MVFNGIRWYRLVRGSWVPVFGRSARRGSRRRCHVGVRSRSGPPAAARCRGQRT